MDETELIITEEQMEALLGRELSALEAAHYKLYLGIAVSRVEGLLGGYLPAPVPVDLQMVIAQAFNLVLSEQNNAQSSSDGGPVSSKRVEDFSVTYDTTAGATWDNFIKQYASTISKYLVRGEVRVSGKGYCGDCL